MNNEYIIGVYVKLIQTGMKTIEQVPENIKSEVELKLKEVI
jgi:hypothetical protein